MFVDADSELTLYESLFKGMVGNPRPDNSLYNNIRTHRLTFTLTRNRRGQWVRLGPMDPRDKPSYAPRHLVDDGDVDDEGENRTVVTPDKHEDILEVFPCCMVLRYRNARVLCV